MKIFALGEGEIACNTNKMVLAFSKGALEMKFHTCIFSFQNTLRMSQVSECKLYGILEEKFNFAPKCEI